jgi:hypothetical protein
VSTPVNRDEVAFYEIRVQDIFDESWLEWLRGLDVSTLDSGETLLTGPVCDPATLHGLLNKIRDLGLPLLGVEKK